MGNNSINKSSSVNIDEEEYTQKINALKECYKVVAKKTGHIFYLPIMDGSDWKITRFMNGEKPKEMTKKEFIDSLKNTVEYKINPDYGMVKIADSDNL